MFGYVKPNTPELLVRENEEYRAVYCSLCRALGYHYGKISRLTLSYDCTFFAMLLLSLDEEQRSFERKRCVCNPMTKCHFCVGTDKALHLPAALSILSMYQKLKDDLRDPGFKKKLRALLLMPLALRPYRKACRDYPELESILNDMMSEQKKAEDEHSESLDFCAAPTAKMLSRVFALSTDNPERRRILETIGFYLGKWVYLIDAADDLEDDLSSGSFNPLALSQKVSADNEDSVRKAIEYCNGELNICVAQINAGADLLELNQFRSIIDNIMQQGLANMQAMKLFNKGEDE